MLDAARHRRRGMATVPSAFAFWQSARSCENVCGNFSPSLLNRSSFVKTPTGRLRGSNANSAGTVLVERRHER